MGRIADLAAQYGYSLIEKNPAFPRKPEETHAAVEQNTFAITQTIETLLEEGPVFKRSIGDELDSSFEGYTRRIFQEGTPSFQQTTVREALRLIVSEDVQVNMEHRFPCLTSIIYYRDQKSLIVFIQKHFEVAVSSVKVQYKK